MSGAVAIKISVKMNKELASVKRGLIAAGETISSFGGYLEALKDTKLISESESSAFMREFVKTIIEVERR